MYSNNFKTVYHYTSASNITIYHDVPPLPPKKKQNNLYSYCICTNKCITLLWYYDVIVKTTDNKLEKQ